MVKKLSILAIPVALLGLAAASAQAQGPGSAPEDTTREPAAAPTTEERLAALEKRVDALFQEWAALKASLLTRRGESLVQVDKRVMDLERDVGAIRAALERVSGDLDRLDSRIRSLR